MIAELRPTDGKATERAARAATYISRTWAGLTATWATSAAQLSSG
eukprot:SAG25_NODE_1755_length_2391_cov_2.842932_1_plen_44_part_10